MNHAAMPPVSPPGIRQAIRDRSRRERALLAEQSPPEQKPSKCGGFRVRPPWACQLTIFAVFVAAGVLATWPRASYITGRIPLNEDQSQYVWSLWWVAHQVIHLGNPWFTTYLAAPVGVQFGFDTLMPLLGVVMAPITLAFGPSASYNLLAIVTPGLAAYTMYRAAKLWVPGQAGAVAAGAFYGLSGMVASQDWLHIHTAVGCVFLPLALEAAIRFGRGASLRRGVMLGLVIGACVLVDQETALLAAVVAVLALIPWLFRRPGAADLRAAGAGALAAAALAAPQIAAMAQAVGSGGPKPPPVANYVKYAAELPSLFSPSPRLAQYGMTGLASVYRAHTDAEMLGTFGLMLTAVAVFGLIVSWRRPAAKKMALLWLIGATLALGPAISIGSREYVPVAATWRGIRVSMVMPYTWFIRVPGLASFREADRLALVGLVGAALLAGAAVDWLSRRAWPLVIVVAVLSALEAGWGSPGQVTAPTALPALDRQIAADHSASVVVDVPFIIRGPERYGTRGSQFALTLATADGHPRAMSNSSAVLRRTIAGIKRHPFYVSLVAAQRGKRISSGRLAAARIDLRALRVGWILVWTRRWTAPGSPAPGTVHHYAAIARYLAETGFRFDYEADGVLVFRPVAAAPTGTATTRPSGT